MKRTRSLSLACLVVGALVGGYLYGRRPATPPAGTTCCVGGSTSCEPGSTGDGALSVDQIAFAPSTFPGPVSVRGVVGFVSQDEELAILVSDAEAKSCGARSVTCTKALLPVRWVGSLPSVMDRVLVQGSLRETEKGLLLAATSTELLRTGSSSER